MWWIFTFVRMVRTCSNGSNLFEHEQWKLFEHPNGALLTTMWSINILGFLGNSMFFWFFQFFYLIIPDLKWKFKIDLKFEIIQLSLEFVILALQFVKMNLQLVHYEFVNSKKSIPYFLMMGKPYKTSIAIGKSPLLR